MKSAMETLKLDSLDIVHAGAKRYSLATGIRALPASELESLPVDSVYAILGRGGSTDDYLEELRGR